MIINQWVPAAHQGDAVGDSARRVRRLLRERGHTSEIYALTIDDDLAGDIRPFAENAARQGDATILHFAVPSPMTEELTTLPGRTAIQYHNLTPAHFFAPWDAGLFRLMTIGRQELASLAGRVDLALGDSDYNREELEALGFRRTSVMPIAVDTRRITGAPRMPVLERTLDDGFANILFVGRIVPQKKIEDLLKLGEHYKRYVDTEYRFLFVGRTDGVPGYYAALREMATRYRLPPQRFVFTGRVSDDELAAYYRMADAYVSLSEHEGFCVPLVEAMAADVPILAYGAAAVPETLGGAGVAFTPKDLEYAAELLGRLVYDDDLRASVLAGQRRRLADFGAERIDRALDGMLDALTA